MTTLKTTNLTYNDFRKSKANPEPPEKDLGLDWDAIRSAYEARLDWEEAQGLDPVERQGRIRIPETEKPAEPVKQSVKRPKKKAAPKAKKPERPERRKVDRDRLLELHKQGLSNTKIAKEMGVSPQGVSAILRGEFGIFAKVGGDKCKAGLHDMSEHGRQQYITKPDGTKVKDGRHCMACRRMRDEDKKS